MKTFIIQDPDGNVVGQGMDDDFTDGVVVSASYLDKKETYNDVEQVVSNLMDGYTVNYKMVSFE